MRLVVSLLLVLASSLSLAQSVSRSSLTDILLPRGAEKVRQSTKTLWADILERALDTERLACNEVEGITWLTNRANFTPIKQAVVAEIKRRQWMYEPQKAMTKDLITFQFFSSTSAEQVFVGVWVDDRASLSLIWCNVRST